jgi:hypothetical protein
VDGRQGGLAHLPEAWDEAEAKLLPKMVEVSAEVKELAPEAAAYANAVAEAPPLGNGCTGAGCTSTCSSARGAALVVRKATKISQQGKAESRGPFMKAAG